MINLAPDEVSNKIQTNQKQKQKQAERERERDTEREREREREREIPTLTHGKFVSHRPIHK